MARRRSRRGQQSWHIWSKLFKPALLLTLLGGASFYAYQTGLRLGSQQVADLNQTVVQLTASEAAARGDAAKLAADLAETRKRADDFQAKYQQTKANDDIKDLLGLIRTKLAAGLDTKRLAFVIGQAEPPRHCGKTATKRFLVRAGKTDGTATWVRFSDLVTVTAQGTAAGNGHAAPWYDPTQPVVVMFTVIGGKESQVEGVLPLHHSMIVKSNEFRFTVTPGARGFIDVTGDRCDYRG